MRIALVIAGPFPALRGSQVLVGHLARGLAARGHDIELVTWAGYGVAVENADERVKAVADFICPSVEEEGVAQVLEAYLDSRQ